MCEIEAQFKSAAGESNKILLIRHPSGGEQLEGWGREGVEGRGQRLLKMRAACAQQLSGIRSNGNLPQSQSPWPCRGKATLADIFPFCAALGVFDIGYTNGIDCQ